jgi:sugar lactone lactonase YvrE
VLTVAGTGKEGFADGPLKSAQFNQPAGICFDEVEQSLLVCDCGNNVLRRISLLQGNESSA